jgi:hypothetical protein
MIDQNIAAEARHAQIVPQQMIVNERQMADA